MRTRLAVGIALLLAGSGAGVWWAANRHRSEAAALAPSRAEVPREADIPVERPTRELELPEEGRSLAPVASVETDPVPEPGVLSLLGRTLDDEGEPLGGIRVTVSREIDRPPGQVVLARTVSNTNGVFLVALPGVQDDETLLIVEARALDRVPEETRLAVGEREGALLRCELELAPRSYGVSGRVLDLDGLPVPEAYVTIVAWSRTGRGAVVNEEETTPEGEFAVELDGLGPVDLRAVHASHGLARASVELTIERSLVDLGDLFLQPGPTIVGTVTDAGGQGLPGLTLRAWPTDERFEHESQEVVSDADGRFCFASLVDAEYWLCSDVDEEAGLRVRPGQSGIRLKLRYPSLRVLVRDASGRPLSGMSVGIERVRKDQNGDWEHESEPLEELLGAEGEHLFLLDEPGVYTVTCRALIGAARFTAFERLEVGGTGATVELVLRPDDTSPIELAVLDPDGGPLSAWTVYARELDSGIHFGLGAPRRSVALPPGRYRIDVTGTERAFVQPFVREVVVTRETSRVELRGDVWLGTLAVEVRTPRRARAEPVRIRPIVSSVLSTRSRVDVLVLDAPPDTTPAPRIFFRFRAPFAGESAPTALAPGTYWLRCTPKGFEPVTQMVEVRARQATTVTIELQTKR